MSSTAAHLVEHVFPDVPVRQWVLSVPFELRLLLAKRADALNAVGRIFVEEVFRWQRERARELGIPRPRGGAVQFPQRFGGSLNLNVHYHVAVVDGVFTRPNSGVRAEFDRLPLPSRSDLDDVAINVEARVMRWLRRRHLVSDEADPCNSELPERGALDACLQGSLGIGELTNLGGPHPAAAQDEADQLPMPTKAQRRGGHHRGFDVHAGVVVSGQDRLGRERLFRYCARPPLSLERLSATPEGMVAYRLRKPWSSEQTHRLMTPLEFMARLCALIPPPRHPLIRFHGVFAPHSSWRRSVVPERPAGPPASGSRRATTARCGDTGQARADLARDTAADASRPVQPSTLGPDEKRCAAVAQTPSAADALEPTCAGSSGPHASPTALAAASSYIDWAELLKRVYNVDALACPCGGRLSFIALITEEDTAKVILQSMGLPCTPPPLARARAPDLVDPIPPDW